MLFTLQFVKMNDAKIELRTLVNTLTHRKRGVPSNASPQAIKGVRTVDAFAITLHVRLLSKSSVQGYQYPHSATRMGLR